MRDVYKIAAYKLDKESYFHLSYMKGESLRMDYFLPILLKVLNWHFFVSHQLRTI